MTLVLAPGPDADSERLHRGLRLINMRELRQQGESAGVLGLHRVEVPAVQGGDLTGVEAFGYRDHRGVGCTQWEVRVGPDKVDHTGDVFRGQCFKDEFSSDDRLKELSLGFWADTGFEKLADLGEHRARDDERTWIGLQEGQTPTVFLILAIQHGVQGAGVADQHQLCRDRSRMISSERRAASGSSEMSPAKESVRRRSVSGTSGSVWSSTNSSATARKARTWVEVKRSTKR
jgi:hypothetical protein